MMGRRTNNVQFQPTLLLLFTSDLLFSFPTSDSNLSSLSVRVFERMFKAKCKKSKMKFEPQDMKRHFITFPSSSNFTRANIEKSMNEGKINEIHCMETVLTS